MGPSDCRAAGFWQAAERDDACEPRQLQSWLTAAVVIAARNEPTFIGASRRSVPDQAHPGMLNVIVVDDESEGAMVGVGRCFAANVGRRGSSTQNRGLPAGPGAFEQGLALPAIAGCYLALTVDCAYRHLRGKGGVWKVRNLQTGMSET